MGRPIPTMKIISRSHLEYIPMGSQILTQILVNFIDKPKFKILA